MEIITGSYLLKNSVAEGLAPMTQLISLHLGSGGEDAESEVSLSYTKRLCLK